MASLLIRDLDTVVTCDDADSVHRHVDLYCEDGRIRAIASKGIKVVEIPAGKEVEFKY